MIKITITGIWSIFKRKYKKLTTKKDPSSSGFEPANSRLQNKVPAPIPTATHS